MIRLVTRVIHFVAFTAEAHPIPDPSVDYLIDPPVINTHRHMRLTEDVTVRTAGQAGTILGEQDVCQLPFVPNFPACFGPYLGMPRNDRALNVKLDSGFTWNV